MIDPKTVHSRIVTCPFCGTVTSARPWLNVLCRCGAKYYINNGEWWDRKTGKRVKRSND